MHNISFDESQHRIVQSRRLLTLDDHTSPAQFEERVIISNMSKHPSALANAIKAYVKATSSSVFFLIVENEWMTKDLQTAKQEGKFVIASTQAKLKKAILD